MKQLLVLRHAKSDWGTSAKDDWHRPLSSRGIDDAPRVGDRLRAKSLLPDLIITSDAVRARATAEAAAKTAGYAGDVVLEPALYLATPDAIVTILNNVDDAAATVIIVGHNPGLEDLIAQLTGKHYGMPTAALVLLELPIDRWRDLELAMRATVREHWRPKD